VPEELPVDLQALFNGIPFHRDHQFTVTAAAGGVRFEGSLPHTSGRGSGSAQAHGGAVAAILDTAATLAIMNETGQSWATVDLRVDYLRPVPLDSVSVIGCVVRAGRQVGRATAELHDGSGRLCATAVGTFVRAADRSNHEAPLDDDLMPVSGDGRVSQPELQ